MSLRGELWKHYTRIDKKKAQCKLCFKHYTITGNTTNFWVHLQKQHGIKKVESVQQAQSRNDVKAENVDDPSEISHEDSRQGASDTNPSNANLPTVTTVTSSNKRKVAATTSTAASHSQSSKQATIQESLLRAKSFDFGGTRDAELRDAMLYMICKDRLPLSTPEKTGFCLFAKKAVPLWTPPKRQATTKLMEDKYDALSKIVKNTISEVESVCLTADCWTESHTTKSYLGVTIHYPNGVEMESAVVGITSLSSSHTSAYLAEQINCFCENWGIEKAKVSIIVTDNAENIRAAVKAVFGNDRCVPCFDHTLNLIPKSAIGMKSVKVRGVDVQEASVPGLPELMDKIKGIVAYSHRSTNFADSLRRVQLERGKTEGTLLRLVQDVPTRWGSSYLMLERFLSLSEVVSLVVLSFPNLTMLTGAELATARAVTSILRPFHQVTAEMGAELVTTASKAIPIVHLLREGLRKTPVPEGDIIAERLKTFVLSEMERRFGSLEAIIPLAIATIVDPRFKKIYFSSPTSYSNALGVIAREMRTSMLKEADAASEVHRELMEQAAAADPNDLWSSHDAIVARSVAASADDNPGGYPVELRQFLNKPVVKRDKNPLEAWEEMRIEYPHLYKIARRFVPMVGTSVPAERLFSEAGLVATDKRSRLTSEHLSQLVFLASVSEKHWFP